jgi:multiple sugar transport system permease protein
MGKWVKNMAKNIFKNIFIYIFSLICILPMLIMIIYSFKASNGNFSFSQYSFAIFQTEDFFIGFWNSIIYTFIIIIFNIPISLLTAYGFSRFDFKGKNILYWLYIVLMLMPFQATMVAQHLTLKTLNILNTPMAVIVPNVFSTFGTILMAQHMRGINKSIIEASRIDGFGEFRLFLQIVIPMCKSIISALTVLIFINYWSMIEQPLVFINDSIDMPLSVILNSSKRFRSIAFACGTLFSILPILLYQFSYDDLVSGISLTGGNDTVNLDKSHKNKSNKKTISKLIIVFMLSMLLFTFITQKVSYIMTPVVEVTKLRTGDLKSDPHDSKSESLGYYKNIVPASCVYKVGQDNVVYTIMTEKSKRKKEEAVKVVVFITKSNGNEVAIEGGFTKDVMIIERSTKPIVNGMFVKVLNRGEADEQ